MAIIIPSKYIYDKSFDPVVDNNIDKLEVNATSVDIVNDYDTIVYSYSHDIDILPESSTEGKDVWQRTTLPPGDIRHSELLAYCDMSLGYCTVSISDIPKQSFDKRITKINDGVDSNGDPNIQYTIHFEKKTFDITGEWHGGKTPSVQDNVNNFNKSNIYSSPYNGVISNESETDGTMSETFTIDDSNISYQFKRKETIEQGINVDATVTATAKSSNASTIKGATATYNENSDSYSISFKILAYLKKFYLTYFTHNVDAENGYPLIRPLTGKGVEYIPKSINVTIYGDTISIDLQDKTVTIDDGNKNKVFSFNGNELIQTTNSPSISSKYLSITNAWKDGKQTAVIPCPIADYSDEEKIFRILSSRLIQIQRYGGSGNFLYFQELNTRFLRTGDVIRLNTGDEVKVEGYIEALGQFSIETTNPERYPVDTVYTVTNKTPTMLFRNGDIVIPYRHTNKGDKPLSINKDSTPKKFKVVGTKISKRQGGMQELTLQEV